MAFIKLLTNFTIAPDIYADIIKDLKESYNDYMNEEDENYEE